VESQIIRIFKDDAQMALSISQAENGNRGCKRTHLNTDGSVDVGIFQINNKWHGHKGDLYDCTENIKIAYQIYKTSGWYPWVVYNTGAYKKYLEN
jgi:hypothetical protein